MKFFAALALIANVSAVHLASQAHIKSQGDFTATISEENLMAIIDKVDQLTQKVDQLIQSPAVMEAFRPIEEEVMGAGM